MESLELLPGRFDELTLQITQLRQEMRTEFSSVRAEIRAGDEETRTFMRVLYEDLVERIKRLGEGPLLLR